MQHLSDFMLFQNDHRQLTRALALSCLLALVLVPSMARAQDTATAEITLTAAQQELGEEVLESFDVVILSRGLLLEPLD